MPPDAPMCWFGGSLGVGFKDSPIVGDSNPYVSAFIIMGLAQILTPPQTKKILVSI